MMGAGCLGEDGATDGAGDVGGGTRAGVAAQGYRPALKVFRSSDGSAVDFGRTRGRTDQLFLAPICGDQNQRLRRPVLFHAPASHDTALPAGSDGTTLAYPATYQIYGSLIGHAKVRRGCMKRL